MRQLLILALAVCPLSAQETTTPSETLFPLAVGNIWTYKVSGQDDRFVVRAVRQEMVGEQTCMLLEASLKDRVVGSEHVGFTKDGLCRFREDKEDIQPPLCVLKFPANKGSRWRGEFTLGTRKAAASFSVATGETNVPAGKFKTVTVSADLNEGPNRGPRTTISYAEGVGMVKQTIEEGKRPSMVLELEKFEKTPAK